MQILALLAVLLIQAPDALRLQNGAVRGEIRGFDGRPAEGIRVSAMPDRPGEGAAPDTMIALTQTDAEGRYILENIPPGRYRIAAGLIDVPTYFPGVNSIESAQTVTVAAASTVTGIDFSLTRSAGVRVSGLVKGFPAGVPAGVMRIMMTGTARPSVRIPESPVRADGTFEFLRVPPGTYDVRSNIIMAGAPPHRIEVGETDLDSVTLDPGLILAGRAAVDDGRPLPLPRGLPAGVPDVPAAVRLWPQRTQPAPAPSAPIPVRASGVVTPIRASDGVFLAVLPEGEYRMAVAQLPLGYTVQSITYGAVDLLQSPLRATKELLSQPDEIRITLTTAPPKNGPAWRKISGRVFGLPAERTADYFVNVQNQMFNPSVLGASTQRTGDVSIRDDGTFEVSNVPPDSYALRVIAPRSEGPGTTVGVVVEDTDVTRVELLAPPPPSPSAAPPLAPPLGTGNILDLFQRGTLPSAQVPGVKVTGTVVLAPANDSTLMPHTAVLFGTAPPGRSFHTPISSNGSFEFPSVPPGDYDVQTLPLTLANASSRIRVETQDLGGARVTLPPHSNLHGRLRADEGRSLPDLTGATLKLVSPLIEIDIPIGADGEFFARLAHGEYNLSVVGNIPQGYAPFPSTLAINAPGVAELTIRLGEVAR